ncbi:MAG: glutathionylspermidine synthase, partial [Alicyclobacillus sp. RIFOXYA1_FULL_53_8]
MAVFTVKGTPADDREQRVQQLLELGFSWANIEEEQYWIDQLVVMNRQAYEELKHAAELLWLVFDRAVRYVWRNHELYALLSIPEVLWDGLDRLEPGPCGRISRYARFDFAVDQEGRMKLLELNADTPTGYVEAAIATPWMCGQHGIWTPNTAMAGLLREAWRVESPHIAVCAGYGEHAEDSGTIEALVRHSEQKITCVDLLDLWVDEGIVRGPDGDPIRRLFALYPKEWMAVDEGGEAFAYAVETGNVELFNPLHAVLMQSKGLQALIWGLHELEAGIYSPEEHAAIAAYMLPTYNECVFAGNYVSKSMFGREGGSVQLFNTQGELEIKDEAGFDTSQFFKRVYQERAEMARIALDPGEFHLLVGMFMINGTACGILGRAGGLITGNRSHFIAIGVD